MYVSKNEKLVAGTIILEKRKMTYIAIALYVLGMVPMGGQTCRHL
jgi:hypothetical protein